MIKKDRRERREKELLNLYENRSSNEFRLKKRARIVNSGRPSGETRPEPLSLKELFYSLLLTATIIALQFAAYYLLYMRV